MHLNSELSRLGRKGERRKRGERKRREGKPEIKTTSERQKPKETPELPLRSRGSFSDP